MNQTCSEILTPSLFLTETTGFVFSLNIVSTKVTLLCLFTTKQLPVDPLLERNTTLLAVKFFTFLTSIAVPKMWLKLEFLITTDEPLTASIEKLETSFPFLRNNVSSINISSNCMA